MHFKAGVAGGHAIESAWVQVSRGLGQVPGHSYGGYKQSGIGREFSLEGMLDGFVGRRCPRNHACARMAGCILPTAGPMVRRLYAGANGNRTVGPHQAERDGNLRCG